VAEPGWYDDPESDDLLRWWDGISWTDHVRPNPSTGSEMPVTPPQRAAPTPSGPRPPWLANEDTEDDEDDEGYGFDDVYEDDFEYDDDNEYDEDDDEDESESIFRQIQNSESQGGWGEIPNMREEIPERPPIMERGPSVDENDEERPIPPWLRERNDDTSRSSNPVGDRPARRPADGGRTAPLPPWLRQQETSRTEGPPGGYANESRVPPWVSEDADEGRERRTSRYDDDFDIDEGYERRPIPRDDRSAPRAASWEEMAEEVDEVPGFLSSLSPAQIKKFVFIGAGAASILLFGFMIFSFFTRESGQEESAKENGSEISSEIDLYEPGDWSQWPDLQGGYTVKFASTPKLTTEKDKSVWSVFSKDENSPLLEYQLIQKYLDPNYVNNAGFEERLQLVENFLKEQYPSVQIGEFAPTTLSGAPAREVTLSGGERQAKVVVVLTVDTLYVLFAAEEGDFNKFKNSFKWIEEPEFPNTL
jgi:hypothetical protein